jgi:secondary thiamine-phosphate synthase enzyme
MKMIQKEISIKTKKRGFFLITKEILNAVDISEINIGIMNLFLKHTSASLTINENASFDVREDLEEISSSLVPTGWGKLKVKSEK